MIKMKIMFIILAVNSLSYSQPNSFIIRGSVVSSDGKPILAADVHLLSNAPRIPRFLLQSTKVLSDGRFELSFRTPGLYRVQFTGVDHYALELPLYIQDPDPVILTIKLKAYEPLDSLSNLRIIGDFNNFSFGKGAQQMVRREDGSYVAMVETKADTLAYQILGIEKTGSSINGTHSDYFVYDGAGDYRSVIRTKIGPTKIIFDPNKLKSNPAEPVVKFEDEKSLAALFYNFHRNIEKRRKRSNDTYRAYIAAGKQRSEFSYDWSQDLTEIEKLRQCEVDPVLKNAWLLSSIEFGALQTDSTLLMQAFNLISPTSPLWSYNPALLPFNIYKSAKPIKYIPYLRKVVDQHTDREIKPFLIEEFLGLANQAGEDSIVSEYYQIFIKEFENSAWTKTVMNRFSPNRSIQVNKPVPEFSVVSLYDSTVTYSKNKFLGTTYLIDFWAVWCVPCVQEMKYLHDAYDRFKSKGFNILSASIDFKPDDVLKFRKANWAMPWMHTFVKDGTDNELAKTFEVIAIPKAILIDNNGIILSVGESLRGERLLETLTKVFGK